MTNTNEANMHGTPTFKWEWNINTVAVLLGFLGGLVAWGYTLAEMKTGREQNAKSIEALALQQTALTTRVDAMEKSDFKMSQLEYRLDQNEKTNDNIEVRMGRIADSYSNQFADIRTQLSSISTQIALTNQALQRLETTRMNGEPPVPQIR